MTAQRPSAAQLRLLRLLPEDGEAAYYVDLLRGPAFPERAFRSCLANGWLDDTNGSDWRITDAGRAALAAAEGEGHP